MDESLDRLPCGYVCFGDDGRIISSNCTLRELLHFADLTGKHIESIFSLGARLFYQTHLFPLLKMKGLVEEIYVSLKNSDGAEVPVLLNAARHYRAGTIVNECILIPIRTRSQYEDEILRAKRTAEEANRAKDEANAALQVAQFALERKQRELQDRNCELESFKEQLEERVLERTAELESANAELQAFTYTVAHDLRAPIRNLIVNAKFLEIDYGRQLPQAAGDLVRGQLDSAKRLARLVNDLLRLSRLSKVEVRKAPVDLTALAESVVQELRHENAYCHSATVQKGMSAYGDIDLLRMVVYNLVDNACKFSPSGGEIRVFETSTARGMAFAVKDAGIGFDMAFAHKLFRPFERLVHEHEFPGTGIGLNNVKRIVERHGGEVWAESSPREGSCFYFTLPGS